MQKINSLFVSEVVTAVTLTLILAAFLNPTGLLMPESTFMFLLVALILMYFLYVSFVWKESHGDEREQIHRLYAGRISFFAGSATLTAGIVLQSMRHEIDPWLIITLGIMILTKILVRVYSQITQ